MTINSWNQKVWLGFNVHSKVIDEIKDEHLNPHITYIYCGLVHDENQLETVIKETEKLARRLCQFNVTFQDDAEIWNRKLIVKLCDVPLEVRALRNFTVEVFKNLDIPRSNQYPEWRPHITLSKTDGYRNVHLEKFHTEELTVHITNMFVCYGTIRKNFSLARTLTIS